ncbi:MAG: hypothetical protein R2708_28465 [Vicinamibacterales bacterium]
MQISFERTPGALFGSSAEATGDDMGSPVGSTGERQAGRSSSSDSSCGQVGARITTARCRQRERSGSAQSRYVDRVKGFAVRFDNSQP